MRYIEASPRLRLRPSHLLLMIYRYVSGVYQVGDLSALNYIKGLLDGRTEDRDLRRILTVSGHGIGEAEMWLADRLGDCEIDATSLRLVDTQLLQFLRAATTADIERIFAQFAEMVSPYPALAGLASDLGLIPYWCEQAEAIKRSFAHRRVTVFSDLPTRLPPSRQYDLIYASHGAQFFSADVAAALRRHLTPRGLLAVLMPLRDGLGEGPSRPVPFAQSAPVAEAKALLKRLVEAHGYSLEYEGKPLADMSVLSARREPIRFSVLAPASAVLLGQLILVLLNEHVSDRDRLAILDETASRFTHLRVPVSEELELYTIEAER